MTFALVWLFLSMASPRQLFSEITSGKFKPLYYFYGTEDYRRSEAEKFVADHFLPDLQRSTNYHKIDARRTTAGELMASLANLPMLGEKEVYIVSGVESYKTGELEQILGLLQPPDHNRIVILNSPSRKMPQKKSTFFKSVTDVAVPVEFKKLTAPDVQGIIKSRLAKHKLSIEETALELLTGLIDGDRGGAGVGAEQTD